jgi:hypothetical protein
VASLYSINRELEEENGHLKGQRDALLGWIDHMESRRKGNGSQLNDSWLPI